MSCSERTKFRTSTKSQTLSPVWNETFQAIVYDSASQVLHMSLWDNDVGKPDDLIGRQALALEPETQLLLPLPLPLPPPPLPLPPARV